jgi:hypothetical protein
MPRFQDLSERLLRYVFSNKTLEDGCRTFFAEKKFFRRRVLSRSSRRPKIFAAGERRVPIRPSAIRTTDIYDISMDGFLSLMYVSMFYALHC